MARKKRKAAAKRTCDHKWEWMDCGEALICTRPGCNTYSQDINNAPFGESKILYMEMASHRQIVKRLATSLFHWRIAGALGWTTSVCLLGMLLTYMARARGLL